MSIHFCLPNGVCTSDNQTIPLALRDYVTYSFCLQCELPILTFIGTRPKIASVMFVYLSSSCLSNLSYRLSAAALAGLDERLM